MSPNPIKTLPPIVIITRAKNSRIIIIQNLGYYSTVTDFAKFLG